jgi:hypothetical protein
MGIKYVFQIVFILKSIDIVVMFKTYFVICCFAQKTRARRRMTWCGPASRKSVFQIIPALETINEGAASMEPVFEQEYLSSTVQELTDNSKSLGILCWVYIHIGSKLLLILLLN